MRLVARIISLIFLVFAVLAGLVDAIQTVAAGALVLTALKDGWATSSPDTFELLRKVFDTYLPSWAWDSVMKFVLAQPAFVVFLGLSLLFYIAGYRRNKPAGRFSA